MTILKRIKFLEIVTVLFFVFDRLSKLWALTLDNNEFMLNKVINNLSLGISWIPDLYFKLVFNRGISWGIFNSNNSYAFIVVSMMICLITFWLLQHIITKYKSGLSVFPECLIFLGSLSNIFDRFVYKGVIDFIVIDFGPWIFPIFNLADCAIVLGVFLMFVNMFMYGDSLTNDHA